MREKSSDILKALEENERRRNDLIKERAGGKMQNTRV
jgi:hypothetical protein